MRRFYLYGRPDRGAPLLCLGYVEANSEDGRFGARKRAESLLDIPFDLAGESNSTSHPRIVNQQVAIQGNSWALFKLPGYDLAI